MKYTVYITQTTKFAVEVEADSPEEADVKAWDNFDYEGVVVDSDSTVETIVDENKVTYSYARHGVYNDVEITPGTRRNGGERRRMKINPDDTWICPKCGNDSGYVARGTPATCFDCKCQMVRKPEMTNDPTPKRYSDDEIESLLAKATPGEWTTGDHPDKCNEVAYVRGIQIWGAYKAVACKDDAALITAAPAIIRQLLAERDAARAEIAAAKASIIDQLPNGFSEGK